MSAGPRGRRPGAPDTRAEVLAAARKSFADKGFRATTIRAVAADAGVDPSLVHHYFGSKDDLFVASLAIPVDPREILGRVVEQGPARCGERIVEAVLGVWDDPDLQPGLLAGARAIVGEQGHLITGGFVPVVIAPLLAQLAVDRPQDRVPLAASQIVGLIVSRYILAIEPLASLPAEVIARRAGPTIQRYLTGDLA